MGIHQATVGGKLAVAFGSTYTAFYIEGTGYAPLIGIYSNGTCIGQGDFLGVQTYPTYWHQPITAGIGNSYYVRVVHDTGDSLLFSHAYNVAYLISTNRYFQFGSPSGGNETGTIEISATSDFATIMASAAYEIVDAASP